MHAKLISAKLGKVVKNLFPTARKLKIFFQVLETYIAVFGLVHDVSFPPYLLTVPLLTGS